MLRQHALRCLDQLSIVVHSNPCFVYSDWYGPVLTYMLIIFILPMLLTIFINYFISDVLNSCSWKPKRMLSILLYVLCFISLLTSFLAFQRETMSWPKSLLISKAMYLIMHPCMYLFSSLGIIFLITDCIGLVPVYSVPCYHRY